MGRVEELPPGTRRIVQASKVAIGVFNVGGQFYALPNHCVHQGGPVCEGKIGATVRATAASDWKLEWANDGEIIACPWHGLEFNLTTGRCLGRRRGKLRQFPVRVEDGVVKLLAP